MPRRASWWLLAIALATLSRLPALVHPAAIDDEAIYSVVGNVMVDGGLPYQNAIERKPPALFWVYATTFRIAGKSNWPALHALAIVWVLATMAGLYVIGRRLFSPAAGWWAAVLYSTFEVWGTWKNLAFNGEVLMNLPLVWAFVIAFAPSQSRRRPALFVAGALITIASLLKQPAAIAAFPIAVYVLLPDYRSRRRLLLADSLVQLTMFVLGSAVMLATVSLTLWWHGILADAIYWSIGDHLAPHVFWWRAVAHTAAFAVAALPVFVPFFVPQLFRATWDAHRAERTALVLWTGVSAIGAAAGGRFYPHYYIQLLPPLALLAGAVYGHVALAGPVPVPWLMRRRVTSALVALAIAAFLTAAIVGLRGQHTPDPAAVYVQQHSSPGDRMFVWGQAPNLYLQAARAPASRYVATFPLTGYVFGGPAPEVDTAAQIRPGAWAHLAEDFLRTPPRFIIDTQVHDDAQFPLPRFPYLEEFVRTGYRVAVRLADAVVYERCPDGHCGALTGVPPNI